MCVAPKDFSREMKLRKGNLLATLPSLEEEYLIAFEVLVTKHENVPWRNIIHLTIGGNLAKYGDRIPGFWLNHENILHICSAVNGNLNYCYNHASQPIVEGKWTSVVIQQINLRDELIYEIKIDGRSVHKIRNSSPKVFENVKVYAADPWYPAVNGMIRNLGIIKGIK